MSADPRDELVFLPLGGSNEIGMNLNAYGFGPARSASRRSGTGCFDRSTVSSVACVFLPFVWRSATRHRRGRGLAFCPADAPPTRCRCAQRSVWCLRLNHSFVCVCGVV